MRSQSWPSTKTKPRSLDSRNTYVSAGVQADTLEGRYNTATGPQIGWALGQLANRDGTLASTNGCNA